MGTVSGPRVPEIARLASVGQPLEAACFSKEAIGTIRRNSTRRLYDKRLVFYCDWCSNKGIRPTEATVAQVTKFLQYFKVTPWKGRF